MLLAPSRRLVVPARCPKCRKWRAPRTRRRVAPRWRRSLQAVNGDGLQVGSSGLVIGDSGLIIGTDGDPCCCEEETPCSPCGDIISATVRFSDVLYDCCVDFGGGEYGAFDQAVTINETDFVLNSFVIVAGTCVDSLTIDSDSHESFITSDCSGEPFDALPTTLTMFYVVADEEWTMTIAQSGTRPLFYSVVSAPIEPGSCIPLVASFTNQITACGESVPGAGLSLGYEGTAAVTWDF
jgi:hypothetical protein